MKPNDPAFPVPSVLDPRLGELPCGLPGLTIRAYLTGQALGGYLAAHTGDGPMPAAERTAQDCVAYADALLAKLAKPSTKGVAS